MRDGASWSSHARIPVSFTASAMADADSCAASWVTREGAADDVGAHRLEPRERLQPAVEDGHLFVAVHALDAEHRLRVDLADGAGRGRGAHFGLGMGAWRAPARWRNPARAASAAPSAWPVPPIVAVLTPSLPPRYDRGLVLSATCRTSEMSPADRPTRASKRAIARGRPSRGSCGQLVCCQHIHGERCDRGPAPHEALRSRHRRRRRLVPRRTRRDPRLPRAERRRQDDDDARHHRLHAADRGPRGRRRLRRLRPADRGQAADGLPARDAAALPRHDRARVPRLRRAHQGRARRASARRASRRSWRAPGSPT